MYNFFRIYINYILTHFFYSYKWFYYIFLQKSSEYPYLTLLFGNFRLLLFFALSFLMLLQNIIRILQSCLCEYWLNTRVLYTNIARLQVCKRSRITAMFIRCYTQSTANLKGTYLSDIWWKISGFICGLEVICLQQRKTNTFEIT